MLYRNTMIQYNLQLLTKNNEYVVSTQNSESRKLCKVKILDILNLFSKFPKSRIACKYLLDRQNLKSVNPI